MRIFLTITFLFTALNLNALDFNAVSSEVNLDTLVKRVRILSSEDSVLIDNNKYLLDRSTPTGRELTVQYIEEYISENFPNLEIVKHQYQTGKNITIIQKGKVYPDSYYIYAGHYDAVTKYCADDNATGIAAILETIRILSQFDFEHSIVYGFWDEEEKGLIGSFNYAQMAASNNKQIMGV